MSKRKYEVETYDSVSEDSSVEDNDDSDKQTDAGKKSRPTPDTKQIRALIQAELDISSKEYERRKEVEGQVATWHKALSNMKRIVKKQLKARQGMAEDMDKAWKGLCPGCTKCTTDKSLPPNHEFGSLDNRAEVECIQKYSEMVDKLVAELAEAEIGDNHGDSQTSL